MTSRKDFDIKNYPSALVEVQKYSDKQILGAYTLLQKQVVSKRDNPKRDFLYRIIAYVKEERKL